MIDLSLYREQAMTREGKILRFQPRDRSDIAPINHRPHMEGKLIDAHMLFLRRANEPPPAA